MKYQTRLLKEILSRGSDEIVAFPASADTCNDLWWGLCEDDRNRVDNLMRYLDKSYQEQMARIETKVTKFFEKTADIDLLIIDDFGMKVLDGQQLLDFMELIEDRHGRKSTIMSSQLPVSKWYDILAKNATVADAILDRLVKSFGLAGELVDATEDAEADERISGRD